MTPRIQEGDGILLVRLGAVGDVIRTLPCLAKLRNSFPTARIAWVVEEGASSILPGPPWLDAIFVFPRKALGSGKALLRPRSSLLVLQSFLSKLREFRPAVSLDFQGTLKSALIALASGSRIRFGFDRSGSREGSFLINNARVRPSSTRLNRVLKNTELLSPLRAASGPLTFPYPALEPSPRIIEFLSSLGGTIPVAVHPGTSSRQAHKRWPEERYSQVVRGLRERGFSPIVTWGPGEQLSAERIILGAGDNGVLAPQTTLLEMRQLLMGCRLFIGGDTGPMHLAWTSGVPVLALFGSTDPAINGPLDGSSRIVAPDWTSGKPLPKRGDSSPMHRIAATQVLQEALDLLRSSPASTERMPAC